LVAAPRGCGTADHLYGNTVAMQRSPYLLRVFDRRGGGALNRSTALARRKPAGAFTQ
jgi:hypothetical protein